MKAPKIPSFFKSSYPKQFSFKARYYNGSSDKDNHKFRSFKKNIQFKTNRTNFKTKGKFLRITFLIIILSLFAYKFIIN